MRTLGIDLAADPKKTAAAVIEWSHGEAYVAELSLGVTDADILRLFEQSDVTGIDCPVGWPKPFLDFLAGHFGFDAASVLRHDGLEGRRQLAYRETDRFVTEHTGLISLSVSADRLAHPAMRCAVIQARIAERFGSQPRSGSGRLVEVYPAASLKTWGLHVRKYKGAGGDRPVVRADIIDRLTTAAPWLTLTAHRAALVGSDDLFDAVIAALTARAAAVGATIPAPEEVAELVRLEGWIHLPSGQLCELAP